MEPLGTTDSSVEAGWDFQRECWREDLVQVTRQLAPSLIRWPGGCLASYYRWREGIGPRDQRKPMLNLLWGGMESNQVGSHEYVDFIRLVGADSLTVVNFESDGRKHWAYPPRGGVRAAGPEEAAEWVDYCNNPDNAERRQNGASGPFNIRLWQIGNETSYDPNGFDCETAARRTVVFAQAMRQADPTIQLIGWGDSGWARTMLEIAGGELQYIAFHHGVKSVLDDSPLKWNDWRVDPARTWEHLMSAYKSTEAKIGQMREAVAGYDVRLALTESHFSTPGRNRCDVLLTWAAGVANARILNAHERNGDLLKIATLADFAGTRWTNNAIMIPTPGGQSYMLPVARVMALYRRHSGKIAVGMDAVPDGLDVTASRTGNIVYLHVVNTNRAQPVRTTLQVKGKKIVSGRIWEIADDPLAEIDQHVPERFSPKDHIVPVGASWQFPAASVSALELLVADDRM
jgi:alpha-L-arabinofuranosidase